MKANKEFEDHLFHKLETYQSIDAEADWEKVRRRMGFGKRKSLKPFIRIAATIALLLAIGFAAQKFLLSPTEIILAEAGDELKEVILPDGSAVTLNKYAVLSYPEKFSRNKRSLQLSGDAFFEVMKDPRKPFMLEVNQKAMVRVLGTTFNISPHKNSESITVQVIEGSVAFSSGPRSSEEIILEKDQQATLTAGKIHKDTGLEENLMSWRTGRLVFFQTEIEDLVHQLMEHYETAIVLDKSVNRDLTFSSTVEEQDMKSVLDEIALVLGLEYAYENETIVIKKTD